MAKSENFEPPGKGFWLFAYGSLMWNPDFPYVEKRHARVFGYHRALCIYSWVYRGTEENPGLVFGLDRGGSVNGMAFRIRAKDANAVYQKVYAREMPTGVYKPRWCSCFFTSKAGRPVDALAFVAEPNHRQYAGNLTLRDTIKLIETGKGIGGPCLDYVKSTINHMKTLGITDTYCVELNAHLKA